MIEENLVLDNLIIDRTVLDIRQLFIKNINEELQILTVEELDKVYKFIRTNILNLDC